MTSKFYPGLLAFIVLMPMAVLSCKSKVPVISSISPKIGGAGEIITLTGHNFGAAREEAFVTIAGTSPTNSSYYVWQDDLIVVRVPESGESGLVYAHVKGRKSNGILFSNSAVVPRPVGGENSGTDPVIDFVTPQTGAAGSFVVISGNNFGSSREGGGVFFSWDFESPSFNPFVVREPEFIEVSETELGYESWNAREIRIRLPDGAVSGNLEVRTPQGKSRPVFFDVAGKPGIKTFKDKRNYSISYSVDIKILDASRPNSLYLWIPRPASSPSQRNVSLISRSLNPFVENHRGAYLYKLENLGTGQNHSINLSFRVEVYAQETEMKSAQIRQEQSPLLFTYTQSTSLIPCDDPKIKTTVNNIIGREQNPYVKARMIYEWILDEIQITETLSASVNSITAASAAAVSITNVMDQKHSDPYNAALLFTAMARAAGIPCIPVAGVLIDRSGQTLRHYWAEFWIDNFGWLPVDPAMGAKAVPASFIFREEPAAYYFGNLDSQRIAFSRGELIFSQMENRGRLVSYPQSYSLQNIWEEAAGGLESYSSLWGDITISGIYVE